MAMENDPLIEYMRKFTPEDCPCVKQLSSYYENIYGQAKNNIFSSIKTELIKEREKRNEDDNADGK